MLFEDKKDENKILILIVFIIVDYYSIGRYKKILYRILS